MSQGYKIVSKIIQKHAPKAVSYMIGRFANGGLPLSLNKMIRSLEMGSYLIKPHHCLQSRPLRTATWFFYGLEWPKVQKNPPELFIHLGERMYTCDRLWCEKHEEDPVNDYRTHCRLQLQDATPPHVQSPFPHRGWIAARAAYLSIKANSTIIWKSYVFYP